MILFEHLQCGFSIVGQSVNKIYFCNFVILKLFRKKKLFETLSFLSDAWVGQVARSAVPFIQFEKFFRDFFILLTPLLF